MKKLTETLIQQRLRTCTTDLDKVLQINITGRELEDVSLLRRMTGVEILSLSVNKISTLADFQNCKNLRELYLRNNNISDINQIYYLQKLPKLELLMLSENPCAKDPLYRMTTIKNLRNLIELDGTAITSEERKEAAKVGKDIMVYCDPLDHIKNYIPDGPQIQRTPTHSAQKCNLVEIMEVRSNFEAVNEDEDTATRKFEEPDRSEPNEVHGNYKMLPLCEMCGKGFKSPQRTEIKEGLSNYEESTARIYRCKFCRNPSKEHSTTLSCDSHCIRIIQKNSNILSAVLSLVKELDYSSLQIVNAEVNSRLNTYQIDIFYNSKS